MPEGRGLFEVARERMRTRHLALRTEQAYLYRQVLAIELPSLENVTRASRPKRRPVVLSFAEVRSALAQLDGTSWLVANLLYGSGLRLMDAHRLRVKDILIERGEVIVRDAKGGKDRVTVLPATFFEPLRQHLKKLFERFKQERRSRGPGVFFAGSARA